MSFDIAKYPTLALASSVQELRLLPKESLPKLCDELRQYLLDSVSRSSGHFASGLGVVELTVALHYVYNTPFDHLVWDVGHQAYPHKILTGRRDRIGTIRQKNGLHPFPWREESEFDVLCVGHSSTSI
ncbi:1-deoxy-D-xylulose-5-phosphate synthase N-terminal domain-containing protein, partial [Winslowiella iniecta]